MSTLINVLSVAIGASAGLIAVFLGASKVRRLRELTGDRSRLTSILSGAFLHRMAR